MSLLTHTWGSLAFLLASSLQPQESRESSISCIRSQMIPCLMILNGWSWMDLLVLSPLQCILVPCECRWTDAACALPTWCSPGPRHPAPRPPDPHTQPRRGGVCRHHQHLHSPRLHWRQRLRQSVGHQPAGQQEPHGPTRLSGQFQNVCVYRLYKNTLCIWFFWYLRLQKLKFPCSYTS